MAVLSSAGPSRRVDGRARRGSGEVCPGSRSLVTVGCGTTAACDDPRVSAPGIPSYAAQLRVYEPLAAFPEAERAEWADYVGSGQALPRAEAALVERHRSLEALTGLVAALPHEGAREAYVTEVDGVTLLCPWQLRMRAAEALADFREGLPDELADAFVPRAVAEAAADELEDERVATGAPLRTHVLVSTWQVPLRWFVLVDPEERVVVPG